jgi:Fe-S-cluster-containing dehydrogenase component
MMDRSRRNFLKISGLCTLGLGVAPVFDVFGASTHEPAAGPRLAMVVDTRKCRDDCTDCINACHTIHNVPDFGNPKDEIKWIWTEDYYHAFPDRHNTYLSDDIKQRPFTLLCNHCDNPPCVRVCPVKATFKRFDGIVMMDYHRCIGCRCCMAACPYGSRSFNWRDPRDHIAKINPEYPTRTKGVAEKCNFCAERLAQGLRPACVEACKDGALIFGDLSDPESEPRKALRANYTIRRKAELGTLPQVYYIV